MTARSAYANVEEIQTTKSEKLLAVVLAAFLLVGGIWGYQRVDDSIRGAIEPAAASPADLEAVGRAQAARQRVSRAEEREVAALERMTLARETYRTALDAGESAPALAAAYEQAQADHATAQDDLAEARAEAAAAAGPAEAAGARIADERRRVQRLESFAVAGARLALVLAALAGSLALLGRLRTRGSRYLPLGLAAVGAAAVLGLVFAGDYVSDYVDPLDLGPLVLSAAGVAFTVVAFVALQRYLARRVPARRVRKGECPFCGFPARGAHCEGCGNALAAACGTCAEPRRVGAPRCAACGSA